MIGEPIEFSEKIREWSDRDLQKALASYKDHYNEEQLRLIEAEISERDNSDRTSAYDEDSADTLIRVYTSQSDSDARAVASVLTAEGLQAWARSEKVGLSIRATVWVRADAERASVDDLIWNWEKHREGMPSALPERAVSALAHSEEKRRPFWLIPFLVGLVVGAICLRLITVNMNPSYYADETRWPGIEAWDRDGDGIKDEWYEYDFNDEVVTVRTDRDRDGKSDTSWHYENGQVVRYEQDLNFDGVVDFRSQLKAGLEQTAEQDMDFDGTMDAWLVYSYGEVHKLIETRSFQNDGVIDIRITYQFEKKVLEEYDRDRNGRFEEVLHFDAFEQPMPPTSGAPK